MLVNTLENTMRRDLFFSIAKFRSTSVKVSSLEIAIACKQNIQMQVSQWKGCIPKISAQQILKFGFKEDEKESEPLSKMTVNSHF